ncbi:DNA-deoxyinosine glycosylase [Mycobacterium sp. 1274761.0]|uniref:DNA-deoxyinosine glycosylase n=1 Tax=Mycobacterium sp. 1274761.0 TaxID=1834077 RepID=UPI0007FD00B4|nr:DNA-deoxyinosine glycosylase [Mycobacterium sp. 1274761.0]OBK75514.1 DNA-deoxyinosine glycosylase [Mycobacterium sp. 1274761.0]
MSGPLLEGLPPIADHRGQLLILGNMPSAMSLAAQQYYGNPRNAFWRITGEVLGFDPSAPYEQRTAAIRGCGVAVWDVLRLCRRQGSLDSAIERDSMVANDFDEFFDAHPAITQVFFNGEAAERNFIRLAEVARPLLFRRLPSTSPAQTMSYSVKLKAWRDALHAHTKSDI